MRPIAVPVLALTLLFAAPSLAHATTAPTPSVAPPDAPEWALALAGAAAGPALWADPARVAAVQRDLVLAQHDASALAAPGAFFLPLDAGDVDADGAGDVLVYALDPDTFLVLEVRVTSGRDGSTLWTLPSTPDVQRFLFAFGDVTGDGADDLVRYGGGSSVTEGGLCDTPFACVRTLDVTFEQSFALVDGRDGAPVWSRDSAGGFTVREWRAVGGVHVGAAGAGGATVEGENAFVVPAPVGDVDGDGADDVAITRVAVDAEWSQAFAATYETTADVQDARFGFASRAEVVSGRTGATLGRADAHGNALAFLVSTGDLTGGPGADVAWQGYEYDSSPGYCVHTVARDACEGGMTVAFTVHVLDGASLTPAWSARRDADALLTAALVPLRGDLDADGRDDAALVTIAWRANDGFLVDTRLLAGVTGDELWRTDEGLSLAHVGDVGGGAGVDLAAVRSDGGGAYRIVRLDGATGAELAESRVAFPPPAVPDGCRDAFGEARPAFRFLRVAHAGDADGDGVDDFAFIAHDRANCRGGADVTRLIVASPRTGDVITNVTRTGIAQYRAAGDLDGDGRGDLLELEDTANATRVSARLTTGAPAWTREVDRDVAVGFLALPLADVTGDGAADVAFVTVHEDASAERPRLTSEVDVVHGATGVTAWRVP